MPETRAVPLPLPSAAGGARRRLGLGAARREALDPARIARRRRVVLVLKRGLPLAAFAALAAVLLWPQLAGMEESVRVAYRKPSLDIPAGAASMIAPRFQGTDERGRPYTVTAETALQPGGSDTVSLTQPRGDLTLEDGAWVLLEARAGLFRRDSRILDLEGEVALFHDSGYEVRTEAAEIDLRAGAARGDRPVAAQGPAGTLDAVGFEIIDRGNVLVFGGPARMLLLPQGRRTP